MDSVRPISVQNPLLPYEPGNTDGEASVQTTIAISSFQSDNGLEVTGEVTPQLAGVLQSKVKQQASTEQKRSQEELEAAQKACLEKKVAERQQKQKTASAVGGLLSAAGRTSGMLGGSSTGDIYRASGVIYGANATADQVSRAAKDLGLSDADIEACRNPEEAP
jgi:peptidoglycan hydrolase-like protein with peptidoglycan-binding domain